MRGVLVACLLAACFHGGDGGFPAPNITSPARLLETFADDTQIVIILDLKWIEGSAIARVLWSRFGEQREIQTALGGACGVLARGVDHVAFGATVKPDLRFHLWTHGFDRAQYIACLSDPVLTAIAHGPAERADVGDVVIVRDGDTVAEGLWLAPATAFFTSGLRNAELTRDQIVAAATPADRGVLRDPVLAELFAHVDTDAPIWGFARNNDNLLPAEVIAFSFSLTVDEGIELHVRLRTAGADRAKRVATQVTRATEGFPGKIEVAAQGADIVATAALTGNDVSTVLKVMWASWQRGSVR